MESERMYCLYGFSYVPDWISVEFAEALPSCRQCSVCGIVPSESVILKCFHMLCKHCYRNIVSDERELQKIICPIDNIVSDGSFDELRDEATSDALSTSDVYCPNKKLGCRQNVCLRDLQSHYKHCEYHESKCQKCSQVVLRKDIVAHIRQMCQMSETKVGEGCHQQTSGPQNKDSFQEVIGQMKRCIADVEERVNVGEEIQCQQLLNFAEHKVKTQDSLKELGESLRNLETHVSAYSKRLQLLNYDVELIKHSSSDLDSCKNSFNEIFEGFATQLRALRNYTQKELDILKREINNLKGPEFQLATIRLSNRTRSEASILDAVSESQHEDHLSGTARGHRVLHEPRHEDSRNQTQDDSILSTDEPQQSTSFSSAQAVSPPAGPNQPDTSASKHDSSDDPQASSITKDSPRLSSQELNHSASKSESDDGAIHEFMWKIQLCELYSWKKRCKYFVLSDYQYKMCLEFILEKDSANNELLGVSVWIARENYRSASSWLKGKTIGFALHNMLAEDRNISVTQKCSNPSLKTCVLSELGKGVYCSTKIVFGKICTVGFLKQPSNGFYGVNNEHSFYCTLYFKE